MPLYFIAACAPTHFPSMALRPSFASCRWPSSFAILADPPDLRRLGIDDHPHCSAAPSSCSQCSHHTYAYHMKYMQSISGCNTGSKPCNGSTRLRQNGGDNSCNGSTTLQQESYRQNGLAQPWQSHVSARRQQTLNFKMRQ